MRRPIRRLLEPMQEILISQIRVAGRKSMNSIRTLTEGLVGCPDGLDVGSEENGGVKNDSWVSEMSCYIG